MKLDSKLLLTALDSLREPLFIIDSDLTCVFANRSLLVFLNVGREAGQLPKVKEFWPSVASADLNSECLVEKFVLFGQQRLAVRLIVQALGGGCRLVVVAGNHFTATGAGSGFHAQRLETLGMLASGVAHDFNNVLAGILGHITYLKTILPKNGPHVESLSAIEEGGTKASLLTQEILNFSKLDVSAEPVAIELTSLARKTFSLLRGALSPIYILHCELSEKLVYVKGVGGRVAQVIVNLVMNARDAIQADGNIWLRLRSPVGDDHVADYFGSGRDPAQIVVLEVEDDGCGIPQKLLDRVLQPYFSTKKEKGTGLGLATVDSIVRDMDGRLVISSKEGVGTRVAVFLPLATEDLGALAEDQKEESELQRGNERILVVDDNDPVRNVLCVSLVHLGYSVEVAATGSEAINKFQQSRAKYDLVILDMLMPRLSGEDVFFELKKLDPQVRVLLISGHSSRESVERILANGGLAFIQKPFTIDQLSNRVRECLDRLS